jgi:hypothetical protein
MADIFSSLVKHAMVGLATPFASPGSVTTKQNNAPGIVKYMPGVASKLGYDTNLQHYDRQVTRMRAPVYFEDPIGGLAQIYNLGAGYLRNHNVNVAGYEPADINNPTIDRYIKDTQDARKGVQERIGVGDPTNALETAAEVGGGMLVPGPNVRVAKDLIKPLNAASKMGRAAQAAGNVGRVAAQGVVEAALPGNNSGLKAVLPAAAIGGAVGEVVHSGMEHSSDPAMREAAHGYTGIEDVAHWVLQPEKRNKEWGEYLSPEARNEYNKAVDEGDYDYAEQVQSLAIQQQQHDRTESFFPAPREWEKIGADTAVAAGLMASVWMGNRIAKGVKYRLDNGSELAGKTFPDTFSNLGTKTGQALFQNDQGVRDATKHLNLDNRGYNQWLAKFDGISVPALQSKIHNFMSTGQLPNSALKSEPLAPTLEAISSLDQIDRKMLTDGLLAKTALDDRKVLGKSPSFSDKTNEELQQLVRLGEQGQLKGYADKIRQHYRDQLDYLLEQGYIDEAHYNDWKLRRPNYVHLSKNEGEDYLDTFLGRGDRGSPTDTVIRDRGTADESGVQTGATADPIIDLPNQWAEVIHKLQVNSVKRDWLQQAEGNAELSKIVKQVPIDTGKDDLHTVRVNGKEVHYKIKDDTLSSALEFSPFTTRSAWSQFMNLPRKLFQQGTTGVGNPLFAGTAAVYDTVTGIALRPKNYQLGVLNEFANKISGGKYNLGMFDPTAWISAPIGAVRYMKDSLVESMAHELSTQLQKGSGFLVDQLGQPAADQLHTLLAAHYDKSIKSIMEEYGAGGSSPFLASAPDQLAPGIATIAPKFASDAAKQAFTDALRGKADTAELLMKGSKVPWEAARATPIARLYAGTVRAIHEGFRYQAFATNIAKGALSPDELELIASNTRRIAGDIGQQGASKAIQDINHSAAYANVAMQTLGEFGRKLKNQPLTTLANTIGAITALAALRYGKMATDPAYRDEMRKRSDSQKVASFKTFGDLTVNIPPELRMITGPLFAAVDATTGMFDLNEDGTDKFDPNIIHAIEAWIDGAVPTERTKQSLQDSSIAALEQASPYSMGSFPMINAAAAVGNVDIPFSKFTGKGQPVREQQESPLYGQGTLTDDAVKATWQNAFTDMFGSGTFAYARAAMDYSRAVNNDSGMWKGLEIGLSRLTDQTAMQNGPLQSLMFRGYDKVQGVNDTDARLWYNKRNGLKAAETILKKDTMSIYTNSLDPRNGLPSLLSPEQLMAKQEDLNTPNVIIGSMSAQLIKALAPIQTHVGQLQQQVTNVQNQAASTPETWQAAGGKATSTIEERNRQINQLNDERRFYMGIMLRQTQQVEDAIRQSIGDPTFSFQHYDPAKYRGKPLAAAPASPMPAGR